MLFRSDMGIIEKRGSWFSFDGAQLGQGRDQTKQILADNPELQKQIHARVIEKINAEKAAAAGKSAPESAAPVAE